MGKRIDTLELLTKKRVVFLMKDGMTPMRVGEGKVFSIRLPVKLAVPPHSSVKVDLGVACDHPLLVFSSSSVIKRRLKLTGGNCLAFDSNVDISVELENLGNETQLFEIGDCIVRAYVLDNTDVYEKDV